MLHLPAAPQAQVSRDKEQDMGQEVTALPFAEAACAVHRDVGTSRDEHPSLDTYPHLTRRLSRID